MRVYAKQKDKISQQTEDLKKAILEALTSQSQESKEHRYR